MLKIIGAVTALAASTLLAAACGSSSSSKTATVSTTSYTQIERLGRPAINEGLVLSNANLNAFNSIPPSLDLSSSIPAVASVLQEASVVLGVVFNLGTNAGLNPPAVSTVVSQFLPDVLRISVNDADYGTLHPLNPSASRTANENQDEVGYTGCVSVVANTPLLCGGRKIRDDVIDITLSYLAGGAGQAAPGTSGNQPGYAVSDAINYSTTHPTPLLSVFPFLAAPL